MNSQTEDDPTTQLLWCTVPRVAPSAYHLLGESAAIYAGDASGRVLSYWNLVSDAPLVSSFPACKAESLFS